MAAFREGAIKEIHMENWMAYSGPVILTATPGVNIVAAANGCGKSAIACAIALGLGFDLGVVSRGENIRSFVKRGCTSTTLKISLVNSDNKDGITTIQRTITLLSDNVESASKDSDGEYQPESEQPEPGNERQKQKSKSSKAQQNSQNDWYIDGNPATLDMVKKLHFKLNLQVNNLLTFLAQANVGKFAAMNQHELFKSTLSAIEPSLCTDLERLINMSRDLRTKQSEVKMLSNELKSVTIKISQLEAISEAFGKIKDANLYAYLVKYKLYKIKLSNLEKGRKSNNTRLTWRTEELNRACEEKESLEAKAITVTSEAEELLKSSKTKLLEAKKINLLCVKKDDRASSRIQQLVDDNIVDKAFYNSITGLRSFAANNKAEQAGTKPRIISRDVIETRLSKIIAEIKVLKLQISDENELASQIADKRMEEEVIKASIRKLQHARVKGYEGIQVYNLLQQLNPISRNGYRQFLRWRRECLDSDPKAAEPSNTSEVKIEDEEDHARRKRVPYLIVSDLKVQGKDNCCIIEEAISKYIDCLLISRNSDTSISSMVDKFKIPSIMAAGSQAILCRVTDTMRKCGVTHFLHELVTCSFQETKNTVASVAQLGTTFVVDKAAFSSWLKEKTQELNGKAVKDEDVKQPTEMSKTQQQKSTSSSKPRRRSLPDTDEDLSESSVERKSKKGDKTDKGKNSPTSKANGKTDERNNAGNVRNRNTTKDDEETKLAGVKRRRSSVDATEAEMEKERQNRKSLATDKGTSPWRHSAEEDCYKMFYDLMLEEIGKQLGRKVQVLRYYLGNKRHIYRRFKTDASLYSDYASEIAIAPKILHDCSTLEECNQSNISKTEQELKEVTEKLRVLSGMLYGRKQDNKAVGGRLYALNREKLSLERMLDAIGSPFGVGSKKTHMEKLDLLQSDQKEKIIAAIRDRASLIKTWIEKVGARRTALLQAHEMHEKYKKKAQRVERLEDLRKICAQSYEEVQEDVTRLKDTVMQQESKHKQYSDELAELSVLIKAISGEIAEASPEAEGSASTHVLRAVKVKQDAALKLENMGEGDLERELHMAELAVKQLERDDYEAKETALEMRDEILREQKLSTEIAKGEANIAEMTAERSGLYERWVNRVNQIVTRVDSNFGYYMRAVGDGAAGQVRVDASLEQIQDTKLKILVKFHADRDLLPLSSSYQSGGERGVTTMVYILAVQNLTTNPFFVIDEINQGLDANYEKRIMELLLRNNAPSGANETHTGTIRALYEEESATGAPPQYFVLTPQLLPNIDLSGATLHFPLNGTGVLNGVSI